MKKIKLVKVALFMLPVMLLSLLSLGQTISVQGTVTNENGDPVPGVTIVVKAAHREQFQVPMEVSLFQKFRVMLHSYFLLLE